MTKQNDPALDLIAQLEAAADRLSAYQDDLAQEAYVPSEQRTVGQLIDHIAWMWEAESAVFQAIADGADGSGWTQEWLDTENALQARISATRTPAETRNRFESGKATAIAFIAGLTPDQFERTGTHMPGEPPRPIRGWIEVCLIAHPLDHLPAIESAVSRSS